MIVMRRLRVSSEQEMIALFLHQEFTSERYRSKLLECLQRERLPQTIITAPDLTNAAENTHRRRVLQLYRGYGTDEGEYLSGFPTEGVRWEWITLTPSELRQVKYIAWDYWLELSGGSRLPTDAAERIRADVRPYGVSNAGFLAMAALVASGVVFPPLILVTAQGQGGHVVLEGHVRLTAYILQFDNLPPELEVLIGSSPKIARWPNY